MEWGFTLKNPGHNPGGMCGERGQAGHCPRALCRDPVCSCWKLFSLLSCDISTGGFLYYFSYAGIKVPVVWKDAKDTLVYAAVLCSPSASLGIIYSIL